MLLILGGIVETLSGLDFHSPAMRFFRPRLSTVITHREHGEGKHVLGSGLITPRARGDIISEEEETKETSQHYLLGHWMGRVEQ